MLDDDEPRGAAMFKTGQIHLKRAPKVHVPARVEQERALSFGYTKDLTAQAFGDPLPWRSALAKHGKPTGR